MKKFFLLLSLSFTPWTYAITVNYKVPTEKPALLKYANFNVEFECAKVEGTLNLKYRYPIELTGVPVDLEFRQSRFNPNFFFGDKGEMNCEGASCSVKYFDLAFDKDALRSKLEEISKTKSEFAHRFDLALENLIDPGGVFEKTPAEYCQAYGL